MRVSLALMQLPLSGRISMLMMALSQLLLFPKVINRQHTKIICPRRGMWLNKFLSNSKELQGLPLKIEQIVLKISTYWTMHCAFSGAESDTFRFRIVLQDKPLTQLESYQPSVLYTNPWDSLSTSNPDWKTSSLEPLPRRWERWRNRLHHLEKLKMQMCYKPHTFRNLHYFLAANNHGYHQCSYLHLTDDTSQVHCSFAMGKAQVTPLKTVMIHQFQLRELIAKVTAFILWLVHSGITERTISKHVLFPCSFHCTSWSTFVLGFLTLLYFNMYFCDVMFISV